MTLPALKRALHAHCISLLEERISNARAAMESAQESANSEDKSSAGDKYETGRAMSQISRDMNAKQLKAADADLKELLKYDPSNILNHAGKGSLIVTPSLLVYIATGIGVISFNGYKIAVVSPLSPLALQLTGKATGDCFPLNRENVVITDIV